MEGQGRSAQLLTRSLLETYPRGDVNKVADLAAELDNIPPTFIRDFLSPEEEETLFLNDLGDEFFFSYLYLFPCAN